MNIILTSAFICLTWWLIAESSLPLPPTPQQSTTSSVLNNSMANWQIDLQREKEAIVVATNQQRARKRLSQLKPDMKLMQAAQQYAELMAAKDQMSHTLNKLSLPEKARRVGYSFRLLSENIALNTRLDGRFVVVGQWMESAGHRKNLLTKDITDIGIGIAGPSKQNIYYYCQLFGTPL